MPNLTGKMLGKVRVDMFLARGGMADVFIGTHTTLQRAVAIKFLKGDLQENPDLRERFEREARVIAMLRHPNIVQVFDFDTYENQPYLVMEYVPGTSLGTYLRELHKHNGRLDINQINNLLGKLAGALKYAHDNDVIHRDIKPANILLTSRTNPIAAGKPLAEDVEPIITDFGLVRFTQSATKQTSTGVITGTPVYMSPEQARGDRVDARTDVYSLGVTVYEMLAGRVPFESDSTLSLLHMQVYSPPPPIKEISSDLQDVMNRALAKNVDDRFATPIEFAEAFEKAILGTTEAATLLFPSSFSKTNSQPRITEITVEQKNKSYRPIVISAMSVIVLLVAIIFISRNQASSSTPPQSTIAATSQMDMTGASTSAVAASGVTAVGLLRFQDGTAHADQVTITTSGMALPPKGSQYQAWLIEDDGEQRISIGVIKFDQDNKGSLTFVDSQGRNLVGIYHALEITVEPDPDDNPNPSTQVAFSVILPDEGYMHVRHLLFEFSGTPNKTGFIRGLDADTTLINDSANTMLSALESKNEAGIRLQAEEMLNVLVGNQSSDYLDWNKDGKTDDPGDGFGLLLNGSNLGYIQGTFTHANLSLTSPDATENMKVHGEHVKIAATNVGDWATQLRPLLISILNAPAGTDVESTVRQATALASQIRNGVDINGNEIIEPIPGEGGAITAYQHAYYMADMSIVP
jgi:serine/threonine protein kinase